MAALVMGIILTVLQWQLIFGLLLATTFHKADPAYTYVASALWAEHPLIQVRIQTTILPSASGITQNPLSHSALQSLELQSHSLSKVQELVHEMTAVLYDTVFLSLPI